MTAEVQYGFGAAPIRHEGSCPIEDLSELVGGEGYSVRYYWRQLLRLYGHRIHGGTFTIRQQATNRESWIEKGLPVQGKSLKSFRCLNLEPVGSFWRRSHPASASSGAWRE